VHRSSRKENNPKTSSTEPLGGDEKGSRRMANMPSRRRETLEARGGGQEERKWKEVLKPRGEEVREEHEETKGRGKI